MVNEDKIIPQMSVNFGVASHFKNQCDGQQSHARSLLDAAAAKRVISTIADYIHDARFRPVVCFCLGGLFVGASKTF